MLDSLPSGRKAGWMRRLLTILALLPLLLTPAAHAAGDNYSDRLDALFLELRDAPDSGFAANITEEIWSMWLNPDDPALAGRMTDVAVTSANGDRKAALAMLDQIVIDYPNYAEGWNQRATLYFTLGRLDDSLADIDRVLKLEPRHFGALAGRVMIYLRRGQHAEALREMLAALKIHPYLSGREWFPELERNITHV